jgi:calcineurin-like phosphoesterase family protein
MKEIRNNPKHQIFMTADTHFGHANILKYCKRPFSDVHHMNRALVDNWNSTVDPKDEVFILGDFTFQDHSKYASQLNGKKYLILGNHDKVRDAYRAEEDGYFVWVDNYCELCVDNVQFMLFHYAIRQWNKKHHGSIHLYGHSHGGLEPHGLSFDVGVDNCTKVGAPPYTPISIRQVLAYTSSIERKLPL